MSEDAAATPAVTGYRSQYCAQLVEFMSRGYSLTAFAGEIGVSRATLDQWIADHGPLAQAVERGQARRARMLEDRLLSARGPNAFGLHMEALKTAAPKDWRRRDRGEAKSAAPGAPAVHLDLPDNGRG